MNVTHYNELDWFYSIRDLRGKYCTYSIHVNFNPNIHGSSS